MHAGHGKYTNIPQQLSRLGFLCFYVLPSFMDLKLRLDTINVESLVMDRSNALDGAIRMRINLRIC